MGLNPKGRNWGALVNWDSLGQFYGAFAIVWTVTLCAGMAWLVLHRQLPFLKIRNIPLAIASTALLQVYLIKILLAYTVNGHFSCTAEFWIMSIYLPFGIALFQANMVQLQSISSQQKKFLDGPRMLLQAEPRQSTNAVRRLWNRWSAMNVVKRTEILIAIGMASQVFVTLAIYLASRKFHASWGSIDHGHQSPGNCRKGWEWIPSAIWQLVWAWFYGPYILYRIRNINDIHYWRLQTTLCVISGLPGTPLWLAALNSKAFKPVNRWWVPPMWLAPGIIVMQFCTIFFPIFEAYRSRHQLRTALDIIKVWEEKKDTNGLTSSMDSGSSTLNTSTFSTKGRDSISTTMSTRRKELYTMAALDKALVQNPFPLLIFAATKDFTAENIVFLMQVRDWHAAWNYAHRGGNAITDQALCHLYNAAARIYASSIHPKTAEIPINIEGKIRSELDRMFAAVALEMKPNAGDNVVDPFNHSRASDVELAAPRMPYTSSGHDSGVSSCDDFGSRMSSGQDTITNSTKGMILDVQPCVFDSDSIPAGFNEHVFKAAEQSIKYLVITNTWPKFVDAHQSQIP